MNDQDPIKMINTYIKKIDYMYISLVFKYCEDEEIDSLDFLEEQGWDFTEID